MSVPAKKRGNPAWIKGRSANPRGRPRGSLGKKGRVLKSLLDSTDDVARVVIQKARDGDLQAAGLIFGRVLPALAPQSERVTFELDPTAPLAFQCEQILAAVSKGEISADVAKQIIESLSALGAIRQFDEFEQRLNRLESVA